MPLRKKGGAAARKGDPRTTRRRSRSPTANRRKRTPTKRRGPPPRVINLGRGRLHVVLLKRKDEVATPPRHFYGPGCQCRGPRPCSCRSVAALRNQDPIFKGDFCNRSYSLEELTRLSYAYEEIMLERTFAAERLYLAERGRSGGRLAECWTPRPKKRPPRPKKWPPRPLPKAPRIAYENGFPIMREYDNPAPGFLKAVNRQRRVRFADEVCGALGTELDRTTYFDSSRVPDHTPPAVREGVGLHRNDLDAVRAQDLAAPRLYPNPLSR